VAHPLSQTLKVLPVLLYGALGLTSAMQAPYAALDTKNAQHESLSHILYDVLSSCGPHGSLAECCRSILDFHEDFVKDHTEALTHTCTSGTLERVPEYLATLQQFSSSIVWGRAVVDEAICELHSQTTYESLVETASRQGMNYADIGSKPVDHWTCGNQDRSFIQVLHPLPLCSPKTAELFLMQSGSTAPTVLLHSHRPRSVNSAAAIWQPNVPIARPAHLVSAVEELLISDIGQSPARLRFCAVTMQVVHHVLACQTSAGKLLELVTIARESESEAQCGVPFEGTLHEGFQACAWPATPTPSHFTRLLLRCTLLACELALAVAVSLASGEGWGNVERHLTSGTDFLKRAVVLACGDREEGVPFAPGGAGLRALWGIVHGPLASIVPVALWSASQIPKVSGKKAKSGSESLVAARQALRAFLQSVQTILTDLHAQLGSCQEFDIARPRGVLRITALDGLPDMDKYRERVSKVTCEAHQKQCFALREVVAARLTLVKSKSSFKV